MAELILRVGVRLVGFTTALFSLSPSSPNLSFTEKCLLPNPMDLNPFLYKINAASLARQT